jgi:hypothetical protein
MKRWTGALTLLLLGVAACYRVNNRLLDTPRPPTDLYRCLQIELSRAGYGIVGADRASGWLHAQRRVERILDVVTAEVYATVIPDEMDGSSLQISDNSYARDDAARIVQICAPEHVAGSHIEAEDAK